MDKESLYASSRRAGTDLMLGDSGDSVCSFDLNVLS